MKRIRNGDDSCKSTFPAHISENDRSHYPSSEDVRSNLEVSAADILALTLPHLAAAPRTVSCCAWVHGKLTQDRGNGNRAG